MGKARAVTERDFRMQQFRDADPADYEMRDDGRIVRRDRWEMTVRKIAGLMGYDAREGFETDLLVMTVSSLVDRAEEKDVRPTPIHEHED